MLHAQAAIGTDLFASCEAPKSEIAQGSLVAPPAAFRSGQIRQLYDPGGARLADSDRRGGPGNRSGLLDASAAEDAGCRGLRRLRGSDVLRAEPRQRVEQRRTQ